MKTKIIVGLILFVVGIMLDIVSEVTDIWLIRVPAYILWPVGMVIGINALLARKNSNNSDTYTK